MRKFYKFNPTVAGSMKYFVDMLTVSLKEMHKLKMNELELKLTLSLDQCSDEEMEEILEQYNNLLEIAQKGGVSL